MIDGSFFEALEKIKLSELSNVCGFKIVGDSDFYISSVASLKFATSSELSFLGNKKYVKDLHDTNAGAVIISEENIKDLPRNTVGLVCANVMIGYANALNILYKQKKHKAYISDKSTIHQSAKIGKNCYIGDFAYIGKEVELGDNVYVGYNTVIENNCKIGDNCVIRNNVSISYSIVGKNVLINSGAKIGESGFGIIPTADSVIYIPQLGRVVIGDNVRIGANTTIDRGSIEDTSIGNETIIDNLVQIGHNVRIGNKSIIVAQVGIAGSAKIGNGVVLAGQVGVSGHIEIGDGAIAVAKSGIAQSVEAGRIVGGIPAVDAMLWKRQAAFLKSAVTKKKK